MKNVLFATTALVAASVSGSAFAASHASLGWSAEVTAGYNDDDEGGMFVDAGATLTGTMTTDLGITLGLSYGIDFNDDDGLTFDDFATFTAESSAGKLTIGEVGDFAAEKNYDTIGKDGMDNDFVEEDGEFAVDFTGNFNGFQYGVSSIIGDGTSTGPSDDLGGLSIGASGAMGAFKFGLGYEEASFDDGIGDAFADDAIGIGVETTFGGATIGLAYFDRGDFTSTGIKVAYALGNGIDLAAYYAMNDNAGVSSDNYGVSVGYSMDPITVKVAFDSSEDADPDNRVRLTAEYAMGGATLFAGYSTDEAADGSYVGADIDLGNDATLTVSWAEYSEAFGREFKGGTSAYINVKF
jgi:hypothetical protein